MQKLFTAVCLLCCTQLPAQKLTVDVERDLNNGASVFQSVNGEPFTGFKFVRLVEGSPFFNDDWLNGTVYLPNGRYSKGKMKLDLLYNELHYVDSAGHEFVARMPGMQEILLTQGEATYRFIHLSQLPNVAGLKNIQWLQQLHQTDSIQLYQYFNKDLRENKPYGSATFEHHIDTRPGLVLTVQRRAFTFQKAKEVAELLPAHREAILQYVKENPEKKQPVAMYMSRFIEFLQNLLYPGK